MPWLELFMVAALALDLIVHQAAIDDQRRADADVSRQEWW